MFYVSIWNLETTMTAYKVLCFSPIKSTFLFMIENNSIVYIYFLHPSLGCWAPRLAPYLGDCEQLSPRRADSDLWANAQDWHVWAMWKAYFSAFHGGWTSTFLPAVSRILFCCHPCRLTVNCFLNDCLSDWGGMEFWWFWFAFLDV